MTLRILAAALAAALALPAADPQLLNLVMPEAKVLAGINVQQTVASPWGQYILAQLQANDADLQKLITSTGFDPRRDVSEVLIASPAIPGSPAGLLLVRGVFDAPRILALMQAAGQQIQNYNGVDIATRNRDSLAFLDSSTLIGGDTASVQSAIDRRGAATPLSPATIVKVNQLSSAEDAWSLSLVPLSQFATPGQPQQGPISMQALAKIEQASGGIKFGSVVTISGEAVAQTDADATALADVIRFLAGMIQMNSGNSGAAEWAAVLNNLNIGTQANVVSLSLAIPEDQFERLARPGNHNHSTMGAHPVRTDHRVR